MTERPFLSRFLMAVVAGLPGVLALPFLATVPAGIPPFALMANPAILLAVMALAGAWAAPRMGVRSAVVLGSAVGWRGLAVWAGIGLAAGVGVALADHALAPLWAAPGMETLRSGRSAGDVLLGVLYGGMTEEVIFRWGLMALLALGFARVMGRGAALWGAAILAALAFAVAHLPAVAMAAEGVTTPLILRTVLWNAALGLLYGVALMRRGLEGAMLAHGATHLGFAVVAI